MEQGNIDLERQSFTNMVFFYYPELQQMISGLSVTQVFPERNTRRMLHKRELIETQYGHPGVKRGVVTDEACTVLGEWVNMFGEKP